MPRIQKVSTYLIWVFNLFLFIIPALSLICWTLLDSPFVQESIRPLMDYGITLDYHIRNPSLEALSPLNTHLSPTSRVAGLLGDAISLAPLYLGIIFMKRLFQNYRVHNIFSLENALIYKRLGWLFILNAFITRPLSDLIHTFAITFSNPPGQRYISVGFGTPNLEALLYGILVLVISWVMIEAYKLQEDKNLTI